MDIRSAIRNLVSAVSKFVTDSDLKKQLDQLYFLTIKPESKIEEIQQLMSGIGKGLPVHQRMASQPIILPSPKQQSKVSSTSGAYTPAFSSGIGPKTVSFGSRIQYTSPFKTQKQTKPGSDGHISLKSDTSQQPITSRIEIKSFDKLVLDLPQKVKFTLGMGSSRNSVPAKIELLDNQPSAQPQADKLNINQTQPQPRESVLLQKQEYNLSKLSGRILQSLSKGISEMQVNTFKLAQIFEKTSEIETGSTLVHNSQLDSSAIHGNSRSNNPLFKGIHQKMSDKDFYYIQENFKMKRHIVRAKDQDKSFSTKPNLEIFLKPQ